MEYLPNTTFINGNVTPVHIEAAVAARRSNLSFFVEYENILWYICQRWFGVARFGFSLQESGRMQFCNLRYWRFYSPSFLLSVSLVSFLPHLLLLLLHQTITAIPPKMCLSSMGMTSGCHISATSLLLEPWVLSIPTHGDLWVWGSGNLHKVRRAWRPRLVSSPHDEVHSLISQVSSDHPQNAAASLYRHCMQRYCANPPYCMICRAWLRLEIELESVGEGRSIRFPIILAVIGHRYYVQASTVPERPVSETFSRTKYAQHSPCRRLVL